MYIDDCVTGTLMLARSAVSDPVNVGSSEMVTINGLVDIAESIAGVKLRRNYNLDAPKGVNGRNSDNAKIKAELEWEPSIKLVPLPANAVLAGVHGPVRVSARCS